MKHQVCCDTLFRVEIILSEKMLLRAWSLGEPYALQGWLALLNSRWVSGVCWGSNSYAVFFSCSRELTSSLIDSDWLVSTLHSINTWRNSSWLSCGPLCLVWVDQLCGVSLQNLKGLERMRFVFGVLVRSCVVDIAQGKRIFEGTKPTNMI